MEDNEDAFISSTDDNRTVNNTVRHQYRVLTESEKADVNSIKVLGEQFLRIVDMVVPAGREQSISRTKIEEAVMWAVNGITK